MNTVHPTLLLNLCTLDSVRSFNQAEFRRRSTLKRAENMSCRLVVEAGRIKRESPEWVQSEALCRHVDYVGSYDCLYLSAAGHYAAEQPLFSYDAADILASFLSQHYDSISSVPAAPSSSTSGSISPSPTFFFPPSYMTLFQPSFSLSSLRNSMVGK